MCGLGEGIVAKGLVDLDCLAGVDEFVYVGRHGEKRVSECVDYATSSARMN